MQVRVGIHDTTVDFWDPALAVARLKRELAAAGLSDSPGAPPNERVMPTVLLQVKPGGHDCYDTPSDDASKCAFIMSCCDEAWGNST